MATPFDRLMTTIRPHLPGAMDEAIRQELFMVCLDFFKRSNAWQEPLEFTLLGGQSSADIMPFAGRIQRLMYVTTEDLRGIRGASMPVIGTVLLPYEANTATKYIATVALTVTDPVTRDAYPIIPYEVVQRWTEEFIDGILSRMMAQPAKPYTNLAMAQFYSSKFRGGAARAKNEVNTGNTYGSQKWAYPQTFANR